MSLGQQRIVPPSPNAASLGIYGEIPVSYYTGIPQISIPIYTIKCGSISLPISLDYHASGIKVSQQASWVGLGWTLNAGGVITRNICGYDDFGKGTTDWEDRPGAPKGYYYEQDFPYVNSENQISPPPNANMDLDVFYNYNIIASSDGEPDVFYFNFNGYAGKFYFDRKRLNQIEYAVPFSSNRNDLDIRYYPSYLDDSDYYYDGESYGNWVVTDGKGYKYFFESIETSTVYVGKCNSYCDCYGLNFKFPQPTVVNSWYLDKITAPNGDFISFKYDTRIHPLISQESFNENVFYNMGYNNGPRKSFDNSISQIISNEIYLSEINFNNGKAMFYTSDRSDIEIKQNGSTLSFKPQKLDSIVIFNNQDKLLTCNLNYNYFSENTDMARLMLNNIKIFNSDSKKSYPYNFEYDIKATNASLSKTSNAIDHWGYFNGKGNNTAWKFESVNDVCDKGTLIQSTASYDYNTNEIKIINGADREPDANFMSYFMLKKIHYPTGGYSEFIFEPNSYSNFGPYIQENFETKRAGTGNTNSNDDSYDTITLNKNQTIILTYGLIDDQLDYIAWIDPYCEFTSYLDGVFAQIYKIDTNTNYETLIKEMSVTAGMQDAGSHDICNNRVWNYFKTENIFLEAGTYKIKVTNLKRIKNQVETDVSYRDVYSFLSAKYVFSESLIKTKIGGGLRIQKIISNDGKENVTKTYSYKTDDNLSAGKLLGSIPVYSEIMNLDYSYLAGYNNLGNDMDGNPILEPYYNIETAPFIVGMSSGLVNILSESGNAIGYDRVTETIGNESEQIGKKAYYFYNEIGIGDVVSGQKLFYLPTVANSTTLTSFNYSLSPTVPKCSPLNNGLMTKMESYSKNGNLLLKKEFNYTKNEDLDKNIKGIKMRRFFTNSKSSYIKFYDRKCEWWKLDSEIETEYFGNNSINTAIDYQYNLSNLLVNNRIKTVNNSKSYETKITYPCDITVNGIYTDMTDNNMIEYPIETREYVDSKLVKSELNTYNIFNNKYLPAEKYFVETNTPLTSFNAFDGNRDSHYSLTPQLKFNTYGSCGRINELIQKDGVSVMYLWSYNNEYPIAEIKNATYTEVSGVLSGITPEQLANAAEPDMTKVETLRTALPNAQITTYTYKPLVGITKTTDPRGVTTYYEYDTFNRLKQTYIIENGEKKILQKNDYHYATQQ